MKTLLLFNFLVFVNLGVIALIIGSETERVNNLPNSQYWKIMPIVLVLGLIFLYLGLKIESIHTHVPINLYIPEMW